MILNNNLEQNNEIKELIEGITSIEPNFIRTVENRYLMLRVIDFLQPIGRRSLSTKLELSERNTRTEVNILKEQGLIEITSEGMNITSTGKDTIEKLSVLFHELKELHDLEEKLKRKLNIKKVIIVPGSVEEDSLVFKDLGKASSRYLKNIIKNGNIVGLTGGSTISHLVDEYRPAKDSFDECIVVPARGGLGKKVEYQANTLVEILSNKLGCSYKTLYTPDSLLQSTINSLKNEPTIKEIVELISKIDILVFGIGQAMKMANRRELDKATVDKLEANKAVSEAFGYYFNEAGDIVHEVSTIGIELEKFKSLDNLIAVATGIEKTKAIVSVSKLNNNLVLVTDESTAKNIIL